MDYRNGTDGTNGTNGTNGINTTMAVNYTFTGLPNTNATVTNVGNATDALLDFTIPQGLTGDTGATGATSATGGQILYFRNSASIDPITYEGLIPVPKGATEVDENVTVIKSNRVLVDSYITDIGYPGVTEYPAGLWRFRTYNYVSAANGNTNAVFEVYNRTSAGTETLLFTVVSVDINALATAEYLTSYVQTAAYPVSLTDRIVVKVYGQTDHASNIVFHWVYEGSTHTSHIQTTLASAPATSLSFDVIAGETLYKGQAVYISGASGGNPVVMRADNLATVSSRVVGIMAGDTANGARGIVRRSGVLTSVDTRNTNTNINPNGETWLGGDLLFSTSTGGLTKVRPTSGRSVKVAYSLSGSSEADTLLAYPMENPVWTTAAANEGIVLRLGDTSGVTNVSVRDYSNHEVMSIESDGDVVMHGQLSMSSELIRNVSDPLDAQDVATKIYVDNNAGSNYNASYITSTFNATYDAKPDSTYNATYDAKNNYNASYWTGTNYNASYLTSSFNATYDAKSNYNASYWTGTNYNASYLTSTYNSTYDAKTNYNASYITSTYNSTYDAKTNYNASYANVTQYSYLTLMSGSSMIPTTNPPTDFNQQETATNKNNFIYANITTGKNVQWIVDMPADWNGGNIIANFLWSVQSGSGDANWTLDGYRFGNGVALDTALPSIAYKVDTVITAGDLHVSDATTAAAVTGSGNMVIFKVGRSATSDTLSTTPAQLLGVRIKYIKVIGAT